MSGDNADKIIALIDSLNSNLNVLGEVLIQMSSSAYKIMQEETIFNGEKVTYQELNNRFVKNNIVCGAHDLKDRGLLNYEEL